MLGSLVRTGSSSPANGSLVRRTPWEGGMLGIAFAIVFRHIPLYHSEFLSLPYAASA